jgi:DnaK suppressor protein
MSPHVPANDRTAPDKVLISSEQIEYFRRRLLAWQDELSGESDKILSRLEETPSTHPISMERAANQSEQIIRFCPKDNKNKLIHKIKDTLRRIEEGSYGFYNTDKLWY